MRIRYECRGINVGDRVGRLTVLGPFFQFPIGNPDKWHLSAYHKWFAVLVCDCGVVSVQGIDYLLNKRIVEKSCGCVKATNLGEYQRTHGQSGTKLYKIWVGMKTRCYDPGCRMFRWYGAVGIKICDEWRDDFGAFAAWAAANGYREGLTIDREKSEKDYEPGNCKWMTRSENSRKMNKDRDAKAVRNFVSSLPTVLQAQVAEFVK